MIKKNAILFLLSCFLFQFGCHYSENNYFEVKKVKNTALTKDKIYYSISADKSRSGIFISGFPILIVEDMDAGPENPSYSLVTAEYNKEPELAWAIEFYDHDQLFHLISKLNYYPKKRIILGEGIDAYTPIDEKVFESEKIGELVNRRVFFVIISAKENLKIYTFKSEKEFKEKACQLLGRNSIELINIQNFYKEQEKKAHKL